MVVCVCVCGAPVDVVFFFYFCAIAPQHRSPLRLWERVNNAFMSRFAARHVVENALNYIPKE